MEKARSQVERSHWPVAREAERAELELRFRRVYDEFFAYAWHSLRRLGVPDRDLPDVTHQLFVITWRRLRELDPERSPKAWLFGTAWRLAVGYHRRNREVCMQQAAIVNEPDPGVDPEEQASRAQRRDLARRTLQRIDLPHRAVLVMHDLDGFTAPQIAEQLQIPLNTVYSRLRTARQRFQRGVAKLQRRRPRRDR